MRFSPSPFRSSRARFAGFTLVEIMIVVALMALVSAIAMPNYMRARQRAQASRILDDLRMIDSAIEQYSTENHKSGGEEIDWSDIQKFIKTSSKLANSEGKDLLGNSFSSFAAGELPNISDETAEALSDVAPPGFWSPYR